MKKKKKLGEKKIVGWLSHGRGEKEPGVGVLRVWGSRAVLTFLNFYVIVVNFRYYSRFWT